MTIPSITALAAIARTDADFVAKVDALFSTLLAQMITEENAAIAAMNSTAATVAANQVTVAANTVTVAADKATVAADKATVAADKSVVIADMATVAADKIIAITQATAAAAARDAAQNYASQAQATNPDSPIRLNPREIAADFTVGSGYNAFSAGPMHIKDGCSVHVQDGATWTIS